jgi:hypothetical protein
MTFGYNNLGLGSATPYWKSASVSNAGDVIIALAANDNIFTRTLNANASLVANIVWSVGNMPVSANWQEIIFANNKWYAIASDINAV